MHPFSIPENIRKPQGFQGVEKRCIGNEWVKSTFMTLSNIMMELNYEKSNKYCKS